MTGTAFSSCLHAAISPIIQNTNNARLRMPTTREMINPTTGITPATTDKIDNTVIPIIITNDWFK